jgi:putative SOS response-associated peptidase YedK
MCGRFAQYSDLSTLQKHFDITAATCRVSPAYNIAPTQEVLAVIQHQGRRLGKLRWGLVPRGAKDFTSGQINARSETLAEKPSFREAFKKRRCLIPADGFYEWEKEDGFKQPWYFTLSSEEPFGFAGLWETWKNKDGSATYHSCTIITAASDGFIRNIHHRMPVILLPDAYHKWLNPENRNTDELSEILKKEIIRDLKGYRVSQLVNSVKNNDPGCIIPAEDEIGAEISETCALRPAT